MQWPRVLQQASQAVRTQIGWFMIIVGLTALNGWRHSKRDDSAFSNTIRHTFRTDTPKGREFFIRTLDLCRDIFAAHILK